MSAVTETAVIMAGAPGLIFSAAHAVRMLRQAAPKPRLPDIPPWVAPERARLGLPPFPAARPAVTGDSVPRSEAARMLGCGDRDIRGAVLAGALDQFRDATGARITTASLNELLRRRNGEAAPA